MITHTMTPSKFRERLKESEGIDPEDIVGALEYVRDDGHRQRR